MSERDDLPPEVRKALTAACHAIWAAEGVGKLNALREGARTIARLEGAGGPGIDELSESAGVALEELLGESAISVIQDTIAHGVEDAGTQAPRQMAVALDDFWAYMPDHRYIFAPTREMWPASSVDARLGKIDDAGFPIKASLWLDRHRPVEQSTWAPGMPMIIRDRLISEGGWLDHTGATVFNLYRPGSPPSGSPAEAGKWVNHIYLIFGDEAEHVIAWLAHRVQRPQDKINHALVLGGNPGVGKDTILEPVKQAIGPWNFGEVSPQDMLGDFTGFLQSVVLRVSEARDQGDVDRFKFYDHSKTWMASPPDVLRINAKYEPERYIPNVVGIIITTNYKTDGIYLPANDRRHFVAWAEQQQGEFEPSYWNDFWKWYAMGGIGHVAAYLRHYDLSNFDAKAPPRKTEAFWAVVDAQRPAENAELSDVIDRMGRPNALTINRLVAEATGAVVQFLTDRKNRRVIGHRLRDCGYEPIRNPDAKDGLWVINDARQAVYARIELPLRDRYESARLLAG